MIKFHTMHDPIGPDEQPPSRSKRLRPIGIFLRLTRRDELPELWNVLRDERSLFGPRPLLKKYLSLRSPALALRRDMRPRVTGWAKVNGRNAGGWSEKLAPDICYAVNRIVWLDLEIILLAFLRIVRRERIPEDGSHTAEKFTGQTQ